VVGFIWLGDISVEESKTPPDGVARIRFENGEASFKELNISKTTPDDSLSKIKDLEINARYKVKYALSIRETLPKNNTNYFRDVPLIAVLHADSRDARGNEIILYREPYAIRRPHATQIWAEICVAQ
jgi:hypothetical protein